MYTSTTSSSSSSTLSYKIMRLRIIVNRIHDNIFNSFCDFTLNHPKKIIVSTLIISFLISSLGIYFNKHIFNFNPRVGFETRGTELAEGRLLLENLKTFSAGPVEIYGSAKRVRPKREVIVSDDITVKSNDVLIKNDAEPEINSTLEALPADYNDYGQDFEPNEEDLADACVQYSSMGKSVPYQYMDYFVKVIFEIENPNELFTLQTFQHLCRIDEILQQTMNSTNYRKPTTVFKHSFNLPLISTCLNFTTPNNCEGLNELDILNLKQTIEICRFNSTDEVCSSESILQIRHYLLPITENTKYVAAILPITVNSNKKADRFYEELLKNLKKVYNKNLILKGVFFNMKDMEFAFAIKHDIFLACLSAILVFSCFLAYSRSFFFTLMIFLIIILSIGISFTIYAVLFSITFFPFLNLLVVVLMIAIGADDAFLLLTYFRHEMHIHSAPWKPGNIYLPPQSRHQKCLRLSLGHSLMSMFITSATTAVAFLSNFTSDVLVLRCFGIYACLTVLVNYILVLFLLPSTLVLTTKAEFEKNFPRYSKTKKEVFIEKLVKFISFSKHMICLISLAFLLAAVVITFLKPGLQIPKFNPTKVLTSSNPSEWFDENSHLFDFQWKRSAHLMEYFVIGDMKIKGAKSLSPDVIGHLQANSMQMTNRQAHELDSLITKLMNLNGNFNYSSWINKFISRSACSYLASDSAIPYDCFVSFSVQNLPSAFPDDYAVLPSDGPIFNKNLSLIGYFISIPTSTVLSSNANHIENLFHNISSQCNFAHQQTKSYQNIKCLSSSDINKYFDILQEIRPSTIQSVCVSLVVSLFVVILCTRRITLSILSIFIISTVILVTVAILIALGWQLSVVESTILILTIGLSFDFSLHIAAGLRSNHDDIASRMKNTLMSAGSACLLAAITSVLCGFPLFFSKTTAFLQVGTMLTTLGIISLIGACLVFPSMFLLFRRKQKMTHC